MVKHLINYYKVLKIEKDADTETIEKVCKQGLKKYDEENYPKEHNIIHDAYIILTDDEKREKYDKLLEAASKKEEEKEEEIEKPKFETKKMKGKMRGKGKRGYGRGKSGKNNFSNISNTFNTVSDIEKEYGVFSNIFQSVLGTAKSQPLRTGANLLLGGAIAGAGVKKGRNFMSKRGGRN